MSAENTNAGGGETVRLADCPVGLFLNSYGDLCVKTEYGSNEGRIDAFIVESGEMFWGASPQTIATQRSEPVRPVDLKRVMSALSAHSTGSAGVAAEPVAWAFELADAFERSGKTLFFPEQFPVGYPAGWNAAHRECAKDLRHAANYPPAVAPKPVANEYGYQQTPISGALAAAPTPPSGGGETNTETTGVAPHSSVQSVTGEAAFKSCAVDTVTLAKDAPFYQFREMGEGEGWQFCSKAVYDSFQSDPRMDTREVPASQVRPAAHSPASPAGGGETATWLDQPLPEDVDLGGCIFRKGVRIGVLVNAARRHYQNAKRAFVESRGLTAEPSPASPAGDLISLSAGASPGEASFAVEAFRIPECDDADLPGILRIGNVEIAQVHEKYGPGVTPRYETDGAFIAALWNAFRSGRLVEAAPAAPRKGPSEEEIADLEGRIRLKASEPCFQQFQDALGANLTGAGYLLGFKLRPTGTTSMWVRLSSGREIIVDESEWLSATLTPADRGETQAVDESLCPVPDRYDMGKCCGFNPCIAVPDQNRGEPDQGGEVR